MSKDRNRELWVIYGPGIVLSLLGFIWAWNFVGPPPPMKLRFASGSSWGAYYRFAQEYQNNLGPLGLDIQVLETNGSNENLRLLDEGKADIALIQGGIVDPNLKHELVSLGSVYLEPLWVFVRGQGPYTQLTQLKGKRLAVGSEGSGTRTIVVQLLEDNRMLDQVELVSVGGEEGEKQLMAGQVDALFIVGSHTIPAVGRLLATPDVRLMNFSRSKAYVRRHHFLSEVVLPAGVMDLHDDLPPEDIRLIAPAATLVVRSDFHQALVAVVLEAGREIHGQGDILGKTNQFPTADFCSYPVSPDAKTFYRRGTSFLYRHLPFHVASALDRMAVLMIPFIGLLAPLGRLLPMVYGWTMKRKIDKRYKAIQELETRLEKLLPGELFEKLHEIERDVQELGTMPAAFGAHVHSLRIHFDRVKDRLAAMIEQERQHTPPPEQKD